MYPLKDNHRTGIKRKSGKRENSRTKFITKNVTRKIEIVYREKFVKCLRQNRSNWHTFVLSKLLLFIHIKKRNRVRYLGSQIRERRQVKTLEETFEERLNGSVYFWLVTPLRSWGLITPEQWLSYKSTVKWFVSDTLTVFVRDKEISLFFSSLLKMTRSELSDNGRKLSFGSRILTFCHEDSRTPYIIIVLILVLLVSRKENRSLIYLRLSRISARELYTGRTKVFLSS